MKLREIKEDDLPLDEVHKFLKLNDIKNGDFKIRKDGRIDFSRSITIWNDDSLVNGTIPIKIGIVQGVLTAGNLDLSSLEGWFPQECHYVYLNDNDLINFDGLDGTQKVVALYNFNNCKFKDLHNVHKFIPFTHSLSFKGNPIVKNILGICLIKELRVLNSFSKATHLKKIKDVKQLDDHGMLFGIDDVLVDAAEMAFHIVGAHLGEGKAGVLAAQEKMIELGLDEFAEI